MAYKILSKCWVDPHIESPTEMLVLLCLADYANDQNKAWPAIPTIAKKTRLTERAVYNTLKTLKKKGIIIADTNTGKGLTRVYRIETTPEARSPLKEVHPEAGSVNPCTTFTHTPEAGSKTPEGRSPNPLVTLNGTLKESLPKKTKQQYPRASKEEIVAFVVSEGLEERDGVWLWFKWDESDWTKNKGKEPIKDWKRTVRTWIAGGFFPSQKDNGGQFKPNGNRNPNIQSELMAIQSRIANADGEEREKLIEQFNELKNGKVAAV